MADSNHNDVEDALEAEYSKQATGARFKQQFAYGVGAAMVFGLFSGITGILIRLAIPLGEAGATAAAPVAAGSAIAAPVAAAAGYSILPVLGLVALGIMGVGLLYLSAKYLSENVVRDQALQAHQIGAVSKGKVKALEPEIQQPSGSFPAPTALTVPDAAKQSLSDSPIPATTVTAERSLADTMVARRAVNENTPPQANKPAASWEEKATAMGDAQSARARS